MGSKRTVSAHRWQCSWYPTGLERTGDPAAVRAQQCEARYAADACALTLSAAHGELPRQLGGVLRVYARKTIVMAPSEGIPLSLSGTTRLYGIMGYPIAHSLSPLMQTLAFQQQHLDCVYLPFPVAP